MNTNKIIKILWLIAFSLTGCGSTLPKLDTDYKGGDSAFIIASISNEKTAYSHTALLIRSKTPSSSSVAAAVGGISYRLSLSKNPDFHIGYEHGDVNILRLRPGNYEIFDFEAVQSGVASLQVGPDRMTPFTVSLRPNEVVYLGSYRTSVLRNRFGIPDPFLPSIRISDQSQRDISLARTKEPNLPQTIRKHIPTPRDFNNRIFTSSP